MENTQWYFAVGKATSYYAVMQYCPNIAKMVVDSYPKNLPLKMLAQGKEHISTYSRISRCCHLRFSFIGIKRHKPVLSMTILVGKYWFATFGRH